MANLKLLHIDIVKEFSLIRPAERIIFGKEFLKLGTETIFLLINKHNHLKGNIYYRRVISFKRIRFEYELFFILLKIIRKEHIEIIQVRNDFTAGFIGLLVSFIYKKKFIFLRSFPSEDHALEFAKLGKMKFSWVRVPYYKLKKRCYKYLLNHAHLVITKSKSFTDQLIADGINKTKIISIPMGFDNHLLDEDQYGNHKWNKMWVGKTTLLYFGAMDTPRRLSFLFRVFKMILMKEPNVILVMAGGTGSDIDDLKNYAKKLNIDRYVMFTGSLGQVDLSYLIKSIDLTLSPIPPSKNYMVSSPTKVVESLGLGTPVVANREIPDQAEVLNESQGGFLTNYDEENFAQTILQAFSLKGRLREIGKIGQKYILKYRTYSYLAKIVMTEYLTLLKDEC